MIARLTPNKRRRRPKLKTIRVGVREPAVGRVSEPVAVLIVKLTESVVLAPCWSTAVTVAV